MKILSILFILFLVFSLAFSAPLKKGQFIFPLQEKHVHSSSIIELPNGDLLTCWYHGSGERWADDVLIQGARLKKGASHWSPVFLMADTPDIPDCNPVLFLDQQQRVWIFWVAVLAHRWEKSILRYRISEDYLNDGPPKWKWQDDIILKPGDKFAEAVKRGFEELNIGEGAWAEYAPPYTRMLIEAAKDPIKRQMGWMGRIHPTILPSGRILLPLYSDGFNLSLVAISDDVGAHWRPSLPIVGVGPNQASIVRKKDGTLVAYMRNDGDPPNRVLISTSNDDGETWSVARDSDIPNPGSSLEVVVLRDGRWVMVYNDTEDNRHSLAIAMSDDEGATWKWKRRLEYSPNREFSFAYPSVIQTRDGRLNLTYSYAKPGAESIKHTTLDVEWIMEKE